MFSRVIVGARDILIIAPLATLLGTVLGTALGLVTGYFRGVVDDVLIRIVDAFLALPVVIVGLLALAALGPSRRHHHRRDRPRLHADHRAHRARRGAGRARAGVRRGRAAAERARALHHVRRDPAERHRRRSSSSSRCASGYAIFTIATLFLGFGIQPPVAGLGTADLRELRPDRAGFWWPTLFPALAIATPGDRRQPDRRRPRRRCSSDERRAPAGGAGARAPRAGRRLPRPRRSTGRVLRGVSPRGRRGRVLRAGRRVRLRQVDDRASPSCATCRATAGSPAGSIPVAGDDLLAMGDDRPARSAAPTRVSMVYQNPGIGAEPVDPRRRPGRRGVRDRAARRDEEAARARARDARARCRSPTRPA